MLTLHHQFLTEHQHQTSQHQTSQHQRRRSEAAPRIAPAPTAHQLDQILELIARPSAAFRFARWTAHTPPASVWHDRGDIPAATVSRGAADGRATRQVTGCGLR